jgi:hypothetical protein
MLGHLKEGFPLCVQVKHCFFGLQRNPTRVVLSGPRESDPASAAACDPAGGSAANAAPGIGS